MEDARPFTPGLLEEEVVGGVQQFEAGLVAVELELQHAHVDGDRPHHQLLVVGAVQQQVHVVVVAVQLTDRNGERWIP